MELTADWNLRLNAAVYSGSMSQYRCYFTLFQPALLFPFLVCLGFAIVFVCWFLFLSLFMHPVFSVDVYYQKNTYYVKLWVPMNLRLSRDR